jgi:hypothetical protein
LDGKAEVMPTGEKSHDWSRVEELLEELVFWVGMSVRDEAKVWFEAILDSPEKKCVYQQCDGRASQSEIEETTGVPKSTLRGWLHEWQDLGILRDIGGGKRRKLVSLEALGVHVPSLPN